MHAHKYWPLSNVISTLSSCNVDQHRANCSCSLLYRSIVYFRFRWKWDYLCRLRPVPIMAQLVAPTLESVGERAVCGASPGFRYNILRPATTAHSVGSETSSRVQDIGTQGGDTPHKKTQPHRSKGLKSGWVTIKDSRARISSDKRNVSQYISKRMMLLKVRKSFLLFVSCLLSPPVTKTA